MTFLTFETEKERLEHPVARKISEDDWEHVYHKQLSEIDQQLLTQPLDKCINLLKANHQAYDKTKLRHFLSVMLGHKEINENDAKEIFESLDLSSPNIDDNYALCLASKIGHTNIVKHLTTFDAVRDIIDIHDNFALSLAAENGHTDIVKHLTTFDAVKEIIDVCENEPLRSAAENGYTDIVKHLTTFKAVRDIIDIYENEAVRAAAKNGYTDIVKHLTTFKAVRDNIAVLDNYALRWASANGYTDIVKHLTTFEAVKNNIDVYENAPLQVAIENDHLDIVKHLTTFEAVRNNIVADDNEALRLTSINKHIDIGNYLLEFAAVFNSAEVEHGDYIKPYTHNYLSALTRDKQAFSTNHPNDIFDFVDSDGAIDSNKTQHAYSVLRHLIRRNGIDGTLTGDEKTADKESAITLLSIPSVRQLVIANATDHYSDIGGDDFAWIPGIDQPQQNELIRLAQNVACDWGSKLLLNNIIDDPDLDVAELMAIGIKSADTLALILKYPEAFKSLASQEGIDKDALIDLGILNFENLHDLFDQLPTLRKEGRKFKLLDLQDKFNYLFIPDITFDTIKNTSGDKRKETFTPHLKADNYSAFKAELLTGTDISFDKLWGFAKEYSLQRDVLNELLTASAKISDYQTPFTKKVSELISSEKTVIKTDELSEIKMKLGKLKKRPLLDIAGLPELTTTIGLEIECFTYEPFSKPDDFRRQKTVAKIYFPKTDTRDPSKTKEWTAEFDETLKSKAPRSNAVEFVSPVLSTHQHIQDIESVTDIIKLMGGYTNESCGLHVHLGITNTFNKEQQLPIIKQVLINYISLEKQLIFDKRAYKMKEYSEVFGIKKETSMVEIMNEISPKIMNAVSLKELTKLVQKNRFLAKVNLDAIAKHGTLEFREHPGTVDSKDIISWIKFLDRFMAQSVEMALSPDGPHNPSENEKEQLTQLVEKLKQENTKILDTTLRTSIDLTK